MDKLIFSKSPEVIIATNTFVDVPVILQYEDTPLIEVIKVEEAGFTTKIPIYHPDGTYIAKVVGSRLFVTKDGEKAGLVLKYPKNMTVCEFEGKTLFEIHRVAASSIRAKAELFTPDGAFVKCSHDVIMPQLIVGDNDIPLKIGGATFSGNIFRGMRIGIWIRNDGSLRIGVN